MTTANLSFRPYIGYLWLAGTCAACLVIGYLFYDLLISPQLLHKQEITNHLQLETERVATIERFSAAHPDLRQYLQELDSEIVRVNTLLPDRPNMGEAVAFLEDTAKETGVVFGALTTEKSVFQNGCTQTRIVFKAGGGYNDLLEFARRLDDGPRFMAVRAIEFHDRVMLNREILDQGAVQEFVEKEFKNSGGLLLQPMVDRGLLRKPNLIVMNVYLIVATEGQMPGAEAAPAQPNQPAQPKS
ncbi:MAG TPA: type 4a pilus biogenesis protein PilO [Selenomonadales bacterium]|nr:type 4a pilus biogenesis protein PilO [Selenomonadales bacterium]